MNSSSFRIFAAILASVIVHAAVTLVARTDSSTGTTTNLSGDDVGKHRLVLLPPGTTEGVQAHTINVSIDSSHVLTPTSGLPEPAGNVSLSADAVGEDRVGSKTDAFFPASMLTRSAEPVSPVVLDSNELGFLPKGGRVILMLWIDFRGTVVEARVDSSDVPERFAQYAKEAFQRVPFQPGEVDGRPVGTVMRIEVRYDDQMDPIA